MSKRDKEKVKTKDLNGYLENLKEEGWEVDAVDGKQPKNSVYTNVYFEERPEGFVKDSYGVDDSEETKAARKKYIIASAILGLLPIVGVFIAVMLVTLFDNKGKDDDDNLMIDCIMAAIAGTVVSFAIIYFVFLR